MDGDRKISNGGGLQSLPDCVSAAIQTGELRFCPNCQIVYQENQLLS